LAAKSDGTAPTHSAQGWYLVTLNATDTNTVGPLIVACHKAGALPVWREFFVANAMIFDSFIGTDFLQVDVQQVSNVAVAVGSAQLGVNVVTVEATNPATHTRNSVFNGVVENSKTFVQLVRGMVAALMGKASGLAGTTAVYRDDADTKARITATVDADGNRSAVTTDLS
jgi:hypothetical protein